MFESICVKRQDDFTGTPIDLGFFAEALLFYQNVHVVAPREIFAFLLRTCGPDVLLEFLKSGVMTMSYMENGTGIRTFNQGTANERHDFITWDVEQNHFQHVAPSLLQELTGKQGKGRRMAQQFTDLIKPFRAGVGASQETVEDIKDTIYLRRAISELLTHFVPEYKQPVSLIFDVLPDAGGFRLSHNLNFLEINQFYHLRVPPKQNSLTPMFLLGVVTATHDDLQSASEISSDLAVAPSHSVVARCKLEEIVHRRDRSGQIMSQFQDFSLEGKSIAEAVNTGARNMEDVLRLLEKADKFKEWIKNQPEDVSLRDQYCRELMQLDWIDKLPAKHIRWLIFNSIGTAIGFAATPLVGAATGLALSATDSFLVDKLAKGWRPNQFVQGPLSKFVGG